MIPSPWEWVLLALAAYRIYKLVGDDAILDRPREAIIQRLGDAGTGGKFELFITCPWCAGFWISLAWVAAFWLTPHWTVVVAVPFAVSAAVGFVATVVTALQEA